jgi:tRNA(Leu) C34 or U34 (ribose-2'-O)-methylase TrmL
MGRMHGSLSKTTSLISKESGVQWPMRPIIFRKRGKKKERKERMKIVLHRPEIPQNTGNIGRLCVATQTGLYLIRPILVFGSESGGLPPEILEAYREAVLTIPMWGPVRSLNLATAVGIVLYEAYRQIRQEKGF